MSAFMDARRKDPSVNLSFEGDFMKRGTEHAIRRGRRRPEEALRLRVSNYSLSHSLPPLCVCVWLVFVLIV
jgi:hypothetical protein